MLSNAASIGGVLPYSAPGTRNGYIVVDGVEAGRLTLLLGPNGSGKTAVLEALGYAHALHAPGAGAATSYMLVQTLRPARSTPSPLYAYLQRGAGQLHGAVYIDLKPLLVLENDKVLAEITGLLGEVLGEKLWELLRDDIAAAERHGLPLRSHPLYWRRVGLSALEGFIREALGDRVELAAAPRLRLGRPRVLAGGRLGDALEEALLKPRRLLLAYLIHGNRLEKTIIVEGVLGVVVARPGGVGDSGAPVAVFHPGFTYWQGLFEHLYRHYISLQGGLPREAEAVELLRSYMPWFDGFEIVGRTLHVRTRNGRRIPVYSLSDGHRVAVFLGLLYASVTERAVFLLDTPEAFMHPDGLGVAADLTTRLAARGAMVVAATQSAEFTWLLLATAEHHGLSTDTLIEQVTLDIEGRIRSTATWNGAAALRAIQGLGADLRLLHGA